MSDIISSQKQEQLGALDMVNLFCGLIMYLFFKL